MRKDEVFASQSVAAFLGGGALFSKGEDPPDCYFIIEGVRFAAEITQLRPISYDKDGIIKNRTTQDDSSMQFCDKLDSELKHGLPESISLCLDIQGPIRDPRKYKRKLRGIVAKIIDTGLAVEGFHQSFDIAGNLVEITAFQRVSESGRKIIGIVSNEDAEMWIQGDAHVILADRVAEKERKMSKLAWCGPRWLILLNAHQLAGVVEFREAYRKLSIIHKFEMVFLVAPDGSVCLLSEETPVSTSRD